MIVKVLVVVYGMAAVYYVTIHGACHFLRKRFRLHRAIGISEMCQSSMGLLTVVFSFLAMMGVLKETPMWIQSTMRVAMFTAMIWTTNRIRAVAEPVTTAVNEFVEQSGGSDALD